MSKQSLRLIAATVLLTAPVAPAQGKEVVVYSARNEQLIKPVFDAYTKETGTTVKFITDKEAPLIQRLKSEGDKSPADVLITVDAGNLWQASKEGVLQPVSSATLDANVPEHLRDPGKQWYGLSVRARTIVHSTQRVKPAELSTYEALGDAKWKKRLCLRTSQKVYNQSLVAMLIAEYGEPKTEQIVKNWVGNLATNVFASDNEVIEAIAAGQCDVGLVNTYYFGKLKKDRPTLPVAIFWPKGSGVHVNVAGAGVTKHAPHKDEALKLLEWLSSDRAQGLFAELNLEYPANPKIQPAPEVKSWGEFKANLINVAKAGELQPQAVKLMDRAQYK